MKSAFFQISCVLVVSVCVSCVSTPSDNIDRQALLLRNNPHNTGLDPLSSLTVGNGDFAMTVDVTGLQTSPERYSQGVPLGTMSTWGWHSFENPEGYCPEDCFVAYDFGTGSPEALYSQQVDSKNSTRNARLSAAADWLRSNPHRLHLGNVGFMFGQDSTARISEIDQYLDLWTGTVRSAFDLNGHRVEVETACHPSADVIGIRVKSDTLLPLLYRVPAPTGKHSDDACDWNSAPKICYDESSAIVGTPYGFHVDFATAAAPPTVTVLDSGSASSATYGGIGENQVLLVPDTPTYSLSIRFSPDTLCNNLLAPQPAEVFELSKMHWNKFWTEGAAVDFSHCTDPRAKELERRVVLSQYLLAVNSAGQTPPQETGLTYNSWFGKFHLEMIYWHQAWLTLWGHDQMLERSLSWYLRTEPHAWAQRIAERQGYHGVRWMKMTDPSGTEAPSKVGSFLIWQQPHLIYLAELLRRNRADDASFMCRYYDILMETATFMADFAVYDSHSDRFVLKGYIPAQETLHASEVVNSPFELAEWQTTLQMAQDWRVRMGDMQIARWDSVAQMLSPLPWADGAADHSPFNRDTTQKYGRVYLASENSLDTYLDRRLTSDHMAVLGALGIYPGSRLVDTVVMNNTLSWVLENWNWDKTWGWDYPMTAMCAVRLNRPQDAVDILLSDYRTNTYLPNGHNYQDDRLRCYLPGNGGLLTTVALMCAGWDNCQLGHNPGWPRDGKWDVRWEGLNPLP